MHAHRFKTNYASICNTEYAITTYYVITACWFGQQAVCTFIFCRSTAPRRVTILFSSRLGRSSDCSSPSRIDVIRITLQVLQATVLCIHVRLASRALSTLETYERWWWWWWRVYYAYVGSGRTAAQVPWTRIVVSWRSDAKEFNAFSKSLSLI